MIDVFGVVLRACPNDSRLLMHEKYQWYIGGFSEGSERI